MKTTDLTGVALDWAVAKAEGDPVGWMGDFKGGYINSMSTDWALGGPIIQENEIDIYCVSSPKSDGLGQWLAEITGTPYKCVGSTPLIAAMRCYVACNLGKEIKIPKELINP